MSRWGRPLERLHNWNQCTVCGHRDGVLACETCQGQGIVATKPGGAGVPFYIGNAQCSACKGLGFEPCSVCMGYQAELPPPDPCNGPASRDSSDSLVTTSRWLQSFPDSRKLGRARRVQKEGLLGHSIAPPLEQGADAGSSQAERAKWEALAKQFYVICGAKRSRY
ncbi:g330 [Coccomyxa viridis]|uniref:G330 protein n=1 Tax=Coccomyxa viridis TaxID=1274662 RepID=A0ABP1FJI0_9CHLO